MIEKIDIEKTLRLQPNKECLFVSVATVLNRVVDAVNGILDYAPLEMGMKAEPKTPVENVQDKFAEQRKWVGKLCKFWDIDNNNLYYGPLTKIHDTSPYCYECNHKMWYENCEPVSEDLIYKGGDNE